MALPPPLERLLFAVKMTVFFGFILAFPIGVGALMFGRAPEHRIPYGSMLVLVGVLAGWLEWRMGRGSLPNGLGVPMPLAILVEPILVLGVLVGLAGLGALLWGLGALLFA